MELRFKRSKTFRFCVGLSIAGVLVVICAWIMEVILPTQRMVVRGFFNWGWTRVFITVICYLTKEWRYASFVSALCLLPALFMVIYVIPESPTWLHNKVSKINKKTENFIRNDSRE